MKAKLELYKFSSLNGQAILGSVANSSDNLKEAYFKIFLRNF